MRQDRYAPEDGKWGCSGPKEALEGTEEGDEVVSLFLRELVQGHNTLLHDGRARSIQEAILWHGGEAKPARERFRSKLTKEERNDLVAFLRSL